VQNRWVNFSCIHLYFSSREEEEERRRRRREGGRGVSGRWCPLACLPACLPLVEWNPRIVRDHTGR